MIPYMDLGSPFEYPLPPNNGFIPYTINYIDALEAYMKQYNPSR